MTEEAKRGRGRPRKEKKARPPRYKPLPFLDTRSAIEDTFRRRSADDQVHAYGEVLDTQLPILPAERSLGPFGFPVRVALTEPQQRAAAAEAKLRAEHGVLGLANNSVRSLRSDWLNWMAFCVQYDRLLLPIGYEDLREFVLMLVDAGRRHATIEHHLWTLARISRRYGCQDPMDREIAKDFWKDTQSKRLSKDQKQAKPLNFDMLLKLTDAVEQASVRPPARRASPFQMAAVVDAQRRRALRDVALIHVMYDLLARSNELVLMEWDRLTSDDDGGGSYHMGKHKTDQEGRGTDFYLRPDTMVALAAWREVSPFSQFIFHGVAEEPVLAHGGLPRNTKEADKIAERSAAKDLLELHTHLQPREVSVILRRAEKLGGVKMPKLSGHSGRVGATQDMLLGGATTEEVKRAGRWKSDVMPARYGSKALAKISGENRFAKVERMMAEKKKRSDH